jgi:hypothetical protein
MMISRAIPPKIRIHQGNPPLESVVELLPVAVASSPSCVFVLLDELELLLLPPLLPFIKGVRLAAVEALIWHSDTPLVCSLAQTVENDIKNKINVDKTIICHFIMTPPFHIFTFSI